MSASKKPSKKSHTVVYFRPNKTWILDQIRKIVEFKAKMGIKSSINAEINRIVEGYFTDIILGKDIDVKILSGFLDENSKKN